MDRDISSNSLASCTEGVAGRMVQHVLMELREVCMAEEQFLSTFFALDRGEQDNGCSPGAEAPAGTPGCGADPAQASVWPENRRRPCSWFKVSGSSFLAGGSPGDSDCVQGVLGCVEPRLSALISLCLKSEPLSCLKVLKTAGQHLPSALSSPSTSVYCSLLHSSLQLGQQSLQAHTESLCREIESHRVSRKARMGVLPFVCRLEEFVCEGERVLGGEVQRWGLDAAYTQLFSAVFRSLESLSSQSLRTNPLVVKLLNFHRLCHFLSRLGLSGLEAQRDEARRRSAHYLREYITTYLGQPFGTLGEFLCGVRVCLAHGVREEEVCFQLAYSKQELRRAVERCPGRAVRRALETVYSRVSRHLAEDESLLQVVWKAIEEELVAQCRGFEELIQKCYPVARISLDFTVQHLLEYCRPDRQNTQT
ncbi:exocyst complex component 1 [Amia ocellicauda]|uniref:exocyst complex component 1 n=1 Tax=Amia ocellicauda TaxID=2972642 RepID=UPI003463BE50